MDAVIYTDGHGVKVTSYLFRINETKYLIQGILNARINFIRARILPGIILTMIGLAIAIAGWLHLLGSFQEDHLHVGTLELSPDRIGVLTGILLTIIGLCVLALSHNKYAVHITTAEGEQEPLVSTKKEYVNQIVSALNRAISLHD